MSAMTDKKKREKQPLIGLDGLTLGQRLHRLRTQAGLTMDALAFASDLASSYIWRLENDRHGDGVGIGTLVKVARGLQVPLSTLLNIEGAKEPADLLREVARFYAPSTNPERAVRLVEALLRMTPEQQQAIETLVAPRAGMTEGLEELAMTPPQAPRQGPRKRGASGKRIAEDRAPYAADQAD